MIELSIVLIAFTQICILVCVGRLRRQMHNLLFQILELKNVITTNGGNGSKNLKDTETQLSGSNEKGPVADSR